MKKRRGISLIVLVITIIVIIILAGAVILSLANNNPIAQANEAKFKSDVQSINSELQLWLSNQYVASNGTFDPSTVNVDNLNKKYNNQTISQILTSVTGDYTNKFQIVKGQLTYYGNDAKEVNSIRQIGVNEYLPYVKDGLVLWYDGIDNGGKGIHNDNTSANKATWVDLSGNGNDMSISNTDFTSTDGWTSNSFIADSTTHIMTSNNPLKDQTLTSQSYTVEVVFKKGTVGIQRTISGINSGFHTTYSTTENGLIYINGGANDFYSYSPDDTPLNTILSYSGTYIKDSSGNTVKMYTNGLNPMVNNGGSWSSAPRVPSGMSPTLDYSSNISDNIYAIRIYNRVLTPEEIKKNFDLDKSRFGII